ncbi:MAG: serine/threonine-protein kinase [Planctomycetota bacterium]
MDTEHSRKVWAKVQALFKSALDEPEESRAAFVEQACGEDTELRQQLDALLAAHGRAAAGLESSAIGRESWGEALQALAEAGAPERIGPYRIVRIIAMGGMGTVYEAEQEHPKRVVAVKVIRPGLTSRTVWRRFEHESELLARLRHPGIAQVFDAGTHEDEHGLVPYFAMEYIPDALPITDYARREKLGRRACLQLFEQVCDAVQHGHTKGVIHRDLKPGNLLVDAEGRVKVIDFGVARAIDSDVTKTMQTEAGELIGTLQYMSPEQCEADPDKIDTRSDVYALGVVLYELLCGRPPYKIAKLALFEAMRVVREEAPTRAGTIDRDLRGDIESILQKTLEKERDRRYASVAELRNDIGRYLAGDAVLARPPSRGYQIRVFARRNKVLVGGVIAVFVVLSAGVAGTLYGLFEAQRGRDAATRAFTHSQRILFDRYSIEALAATERGDLGEAYLWFAHAAALQGIDAARADANAIRLRSWNRRMPVPVLAWRGKAEDWAFHPSGRYLRLVSMPGEEDARVTTIFDLELDREVPLPFEARFARWSPDGSWLTLVTDDAVEIHRFPGGGRLHRLDVPGVKRVVFGPHGRYLVLHQAERIRIWNCRTQEFEGDVRVGSDAYLVFNSRGDRVALCDRSTATVCMFPADGEFEALTPPFQNSSVGVRFADRDSKVLAPSGNGFVIRDAETGAELGKIDSPGGHYKWYDTSRDQRHVVICGEGTARLHDAGTGEPVSPVLQHTLDSTAAAFDASGTVVATGDDDHRVRFWSVPDGRRLGTLSLHAYPHFLEFSLDGRFLSTMERGGLLRVWRLRERAPRDFEIASSEFRGGSIATSPDGRYFMPNRQPRPAAHTVRVHDVMTGQSVGAAIESPGKLDGGAISPDGVQIVTLVTISRIGKLHFWDRRTGTAMVPAVPLPSRAVHCAYDSTGRFVAVGCTGGEHVVVDTKSGAVRTLGGSEGRSPEGVLFAANDVVVSWSTKAMVASPDGQVGTPASTRMQAWSALTAKPLYEPVRFDRRCWSVALSPDGRHLAMGMQGDLLHILDVRTGRAAVPPLEQPHGHRIKAVAFSHDGTRLATATDDPYAYVWDWRKGTRIGLPLEHPDARVYLVRFSRDDRYLFTCGGGPRERGLWMWDLKTGLPAAPPRRDLMTWQIANASDGRSLVSYAEGHRAGRSRSSVRGFDLAHLLDPVEPPDVAAAIALGELASGQRLVGGRLDPLSAPEWEERLRANPEIRRSQARAVVAPLSMEIERVDAGAFRVVARYASAGNLHRWAVVRIGELEFPLRLDQRRRRPEVYASALLTTDPTPEGGWAGVWDSSWLANRATRRAVVRIDASGGVAWSDKRAIDVAIDGDRLSFRTDDGLQIEWTLRRGGRSFMGTRKVAGARRARQWWANRAEPIQARAGDTIEVTVAGKTARHEIAR